mgnify:CR=1 FL=1
MSEPVTEAMPVGVKVKPTKPKPVAKAKSVNKPKAKSTEKKVKAKDKVDRSMSPLPASEQRDALVKLLRKLNATSGATARPLDLLAEKLGYTHYNVYCLVYHNRPLIVNGFVKTAKVEEHKGLCAYLTAKGQKTLPSE